MKVLIIDDSFHSRRYVQFMLQQLNCEVYTAESGEIGLEVAKKEQMDLIILDWNMPGLGGKKTLEELHHLNQNLDHPFKIVIYSGFIGCRIFLLFKALVSAQAIDAVFLLDSARIRKMGTALYEKGFKNWTSNFF